MTEPGESCQSSDLLIHFDLQFHADTVGTSGATRFCLVLNGTPIMLKVGTTGTIFDTRAVSGAKCDAGIIHFGTTGARPHAQSGTTGTTYSCSGAKNDTTGTMQTARYY